MDNQPRNSSSRDYGIPPSDFRLPDETHPGRVRLQVGDLDRSLDYYREVLGFTVLERAGAVATLGASGGEARSLIELHERKGAAPAGDRRLLGLYHYALLLPERAALGRFMRHLERLSVRAGASDHLVSESIYLADPDGLGIEVYADRPRSEWRHRDRQLVMATEPLDTADLIRAGGSEPWTGVPQGTRIGHVHLHVGDMDSAAAFYHEGLGLDRVVWNYPGALFLSAGGYHHHLGVNTWARGAASPTGEDAQLLEWELVLPSGEAVRGVVDHLASGGHRIEEDEEPAGAGALVRDPWGTAVRIRAE